jgi:hypothetical protein
VMVGPIWPEGLGDVYKGESTLDKLEATSDSICVTHPLIP